MFAKKQHGDVKKSTQKLLDPKKDTVTRLKHLRIVLAECQDTAEVKKFCEANYHCIYFIFYDVFIQVEASLRQRAHKAHREELESVLYIFEKILTLLPELLHRRWQFHSIGRIMKKLLHPGNALRLRKEAMRLFLIWYQVLGERSSGELDLIYASLVPGFPNPSNSSGAHSLESLISDSAYSSSPVFHDSAVSAVEIQPILPPQSGEKQLDSPCHYFMESLLDYSVSQVVRVEWSDVKMHTICFDFLFERLKTFYLPYIFPNMSQQMSLYQPKLTLPEVRKLSAGDVDRERDVTLCQVAVIRWMCLFMHELKKHDTLTIGSVNSPSISDTLKDIPETGNEGDTDRSQSTEASDTPTAEGDSLSSSIGSAAPRHSSTEQEIVRYVLNSTRENVNLVHEVFRQAFFVPPAHAAAIRRVLFAYKDWLQTINSSDMPLFMQEPLAKELELRAKEAANRKSAIYTPPFPSEDMLDKHFTQEERKMEDVRAGMQNVLQVFMTNAASVFLLNGNWALASHLDDHIDICKRVLSIYRYVVMNVTMATATWEQLLKVLMHVISSVLEGRPAIKEKTLGGRLASVLFQTLIVTWIKANLNVYISAELWDQFLSVLSSLTHWEELVQEWSKTMDTLTRVLVRHVYSLELNDLPLDRLTEQKRKRTKGQNCCVESSRQDQHRLAAGTFTRNWSRYSGPPAVGNGYENRECLSPADKLENSGTLLRSKEEYGRVRSVSGGDVTEQPRPMSLGTTVTLPLVRSTSDGDLSSKDNSPDCLQGGEEIMLASRGRMSDDPQLLKAFAMNHATSLEEEGSKIYQDQEYDEEVASISVSGDSHSIDRLSLGATLLERSERGSSTPSPPGMNFEVGSHSRSVSPSSFDTRAVQETGEVVSMPIDVVVTDDGQVKVTDLENQGCVLAGGCVQGWLPDSAVVLWQRMLGCLGNVNKIKDPKIHAQVMEYICNLYNVLLKVRLNQGVSGDSQTSPPPPALIPPLHVFAPWLFQSILEQTDEYKKGKLIAYKLLCMETCQRHDIELPPEYLSHLYSILHTGLVSSDQDVVNTIVRYSSPRFFSLCLPGATMLLQGYMHAANTILATTGMREEPRTEAVSLLGSLICFANLYGSMPVLQTRVADSGTPGVELPTPGPELLTREHAKDIIINALMRCGRKEPAGLARCIAISSIGIYLYEELTHATFHSKMREAFDVLLLALRFNNMAVARVATDSLLMLCDHARLIVHSFPDLPRKIIQELSTAISSLLISEPSSGDMGKKLLVLMMMTLCDWCMNLPLHLLTQSPEQERKNLLLKVFKVLNIACTGTGNAIFKGSTSAHSLSELASTTTNTMMSDCDPSSLLDGIKGLTPPTTPSKSSSLKREQTDGASAAGDIVKLTARTVMSYLVNHLGHFPMGAGPSILNSLVNENDDVSGMSDDDLSTEIFNSPHVQFFVLNNCMLVSCVEIPALEQPGGGVTAGLITARAQVRVIVRDISGKYCWDSSVLYAPPNYKDGLYPAETADSMLASWNSDTPHDISPLKRPVATATSSPRSPTKKCRDLDEIPKFEDFCDDSHRDNLDEMLQYIGCTSPECLLYPDKPLNIPAPPLEGITEHVESNTVNMILNQYDYEMDYYRKHCNDTFVGAKAEQPTGAQEAAMAFHYCRQMLCQLGFLSWEKRAEFDLLKKNEKLLRELRNLDIQKCRETHKIAVIYVAEGQEDKISVLSNPAGSRAFEEFVAGLGWEVDLGQHPGFMGGLQSNKSTGGTAPYYATSSLEVIYHVSTRMPSHTDDSRHVKLRHLGNDEVHIVWSEHTRDYRRGIIATEFNDIMIVIYPLPNLLYRIQISKKPEIPYFGPLFDGAIVDHRVLPGLVRATAINASRVKRSLIPLYQSFFEERAKYIDNVVKSLKDPTSFEEFTAKVFSPSNRAFDQVLGVRGMASPGDVPVATGGSSLTSALLDVSQIKQQHGYRASPSSSSHSSHSSQTQPSPLPSQQQQQQQQQPASSQPSPHAQHAAAAHHHVLQQQPTVTFGMVGGRVVRDADATLPESPTRIQQFKLAVTRGRSASVPEPGSFIFKRK